jgi:hypothetical protein
MKASDKQSNWLAEILDRVGNKRELEDSKSVPVGLPVGQNEPPVPIGCHTQPGEQTGGKNRMTNQQGP